MDSKDKKGHGMNRDPFRANNRVTGNCNALQRYGYIPLDFIKGELLNVSYEDISNNSRLEQYFESKDGEVMKEYFRFQNMKFRVFESGRITIEGSLHKYYNHGIHNHNGFSESQFQETLSRFEYELGVRPEDIRLTCLEYGVNIQPSISTSTVLNHCLQHKGKDIEQTISNARGKYHQAQHSTYILKLYDKALQYGLSVQNMRVEVKVTNWSTYRLQGIVTLADFIQVDKTQFVHRLVDEWNEVIFFDPIARLSCDWSEMADKEYWRHLRATRTRTTFKRHKDKLTAFNKAHGGGIQSQVSELILEKIKLSNDANESVMD